jgi:glycosyltransferase involved in cell wall biosynthesis
MNDPLVSFVVPTYNVAAFLGDCLRAIFAQTATADYEVIVVNDASTDNTDAVVHSFDDPRLIYMRHIHNQGHVVTFNEGLLRARGKYIARIDSDDRHRPYFLERTLPVFDKYSDVGLVYGDAALVDAQGVIQAPEVDTRHGGRDYCGDEYLDLLEENFITSPTVIARREAWTRVLPIPAGLDFTDWYLTLRVARLYPLYFVNEVLADYRLHGSNLHRAMVRDYGEERTIRRLLDEAFAEPDHAAEKQRRKNRIYAAHAARMGDKYFGNEMYADAQRCYWQAAQILPSTLTNPGIVRRLAATYNPNVYLRLKRAVRAVR